jgi:hypothetical protein
MAANSGKVLRNKFLFLFVSVFALAVWTASIPFFYCVGQAAVGGAHDPSPTFVTVSGSSEARGGGNAFLDAAVGRLYIDSFTGSSDSYDYQKAVWRHQSEADRRTAREVEMASLRVWRDTLKTYETEYIRSVTEGGSCAVGRSVDVRDWLKAIERILPS